MRITSPQAHISTTVCAFLLTGVLAPAIATAGNRITDTHLFSVGVYEQDVDVKASATVDPHPEIKIDFDEVLGLDESATSVFVSYQWRFAEKWRLSTFYTNLDGDGEKEATQDFTYNGQDYTAGAQVGVELGIDTYLLAADYSFIVDDRKELGIGFGLHAFDLETTIEVKAGIRDDESDETVSGRGTRTSSDLLAPLPNIRIFGHYMLSPKWGVHGALGWLSANYDDYDGEYLFFTLQTEYRFTERFAAGLSYQISQIDVTKDTKRGSRHFDIDQYGPSIYLTYGF